MIANRVEQQIIRRTHPLWNVIDEMYFKQQTSPFIYYGGIYTIEE